ncbi:hypothetical protein CCY99_04450 [Helicobacter sp. 16-1353]|uniref:bifunctional folylpolyglutamate synthase/dihydrofolate synthase n=1 Tax=Helicobacter sp. 16-1353 TaxID=2004996 RepID=UPI000DCF3413|nr:bifunctional folylpolyglutamate synthase/dihydrofolate synthase [Helicobacter sp. 16-1353]RAX54267.1 hypothetical protein CCY99_04450 [Helicobacter sp. 16-1353]
MNELDIYMHSLGREYRAFNPNRAKEIYKKLLPNLPKIPKTIQIIGTNGKGSSGRFLSLALMQNNYKILHFTSPHIFSFNERFYKNGRTISDLEILEAHKFLQYFDFIKEASYFEYATFLALVLSNDVDFLILEAGVGGEFDSTSAIKRDLCLFSLIDFDHEEMLGDTIEKIATTKLNAMVNPSIIGIQKHRSIKDIAKKIAYKKNISDLFFVDSINNDILLYLQKYHLASFLGENLALSLKALEVLCINYDLTSLPNLDLIGRFQKIKENIIIDVGHNQSAAKALKDNLKDKKIILVYNSYFQKNIVEILDILRDNILKVEIIDIKDNDRIINKNDLIAILKRLDIKYSDFKGIDNNEKYLVFGSFSVIEKFLLSLKDNINMEICSEKY